MLIGKGKNYVRFFLLPRLLIVREEEFKISYMYYLIKKVRKKILDIPFNIWYTFCGKGEIEMTTTIVTSKGQIVIPSRIRRRLNIKRGTKLYIEERGDELILKAVTPAYFERIAGVLPTKGKLSKALIEEREKDKER